MFKHSSTKSFRNFLIVSAIAGCFTFLPKAHPEGSLLLGGNDDDDSPTNKTVSVASGEVVPKPSPEALANRTFVAALKYAIQGREHERSNDVPHALGAYLNAARLLVSIPEQYPESPIAVDLLQDKTSLRGLTVGVLFGEKIPTLTTNLAMEDMFFMAYVLQAREQETNSPYDIEAERQKAWLAAARGGDFATAQKLFVQGTVLATNFDNGILPKTYALRASSAVNLYAALPKSLSLEERRQAAEWTLAEVAAAEKTERKYSWSSWSSSPYVHLAGLLLSDGLEGQFGKIPKGPQQTAAAALFKNGWDGEPPADFAAKLAEYQRYMKPANQIDAYWRLGLAWQKAGQPEKAKDAYHQAIQIAENNPAEPDWTVDADAIHVGSEICHVYNRDNQLIAFLQAGDFTDALDYAGTMASGWGADRPVGNMQCRSRAYLDVLLAASAAGDTTNMLKAATSFMNLFLQADASWREKMLNQNRFAGMDVLGSMKQVYDIKAIIEKAGNAALKKFFQAIASDCEASVLKNYGDQGLQEARNYYASGSSAYIPAAPTNTTLIVSQVEAITNDLTRIQTKSEHLYEVLVETNAATAALGAAWVEDAEQVFQSSTNADVKQSAEELEKSILRRVAEKGLAQMFLANLSTNKSWLWVKAQLIGALAQADRLTEARAIYEPLFAAPEKPRSNEDQAAYDSNQYSAAKALAQAGEAEVAPRDLPGLMLKIKLEPEQKERMFYDLLATSAGNANSKLAEQYATLYLNAKEEALPAENKNMDDQRLDAGRTFVLRGLVDMAQSLTNKIQDSVKKDLLLLAIAGRQLTDGQPAAALVSLQQIKNPGDKTVAQTTAFCGINDPSLNHEEMKTSALLALDRPADALMAALTATNTHSVASCFAKVAGYGAVHHAVWDDATKAKLMTIAGEAVGKPEAMLPAKFSSPWPVWGQEN